MRSKLEPGCRAIATGGPVNAGIIVTVGKFIGWIHDFEKPDIWEVDKDMEFDCDGETLYYKLYPACDMQRIDDHPDKETLLESANIITHI